VAEQLGDKKLALNEHALSSHFLKVNIRAKASIMSSAFLKALWFLIRRSVGSVIKLSKKQAATASQKQENHSPL
jgi:hypothetical protein